MIGSTFAARTAGYSPKIIPIAILIPTDNTMLINVTIVGIPEKSVMSHGMNTPTPMPRKPPTVDKTTVSIMNWLMI